MLPYFPASRTLTGLPRYYWALALVSLTLLLASTCHRIVHTDDAWIGEQAWWAAHQGYVRSELFRGQLHAEVYQEVYHKLFVWQGALVIKLIGWSVYALKSISLLYLALLAWLSARYLQVLLPARPAGTTGLYLSLLLSNALVAEYSFTFRPELMLAALGFGSWLLLRRALPTGAAWPAAGAGLLAGLATLTHLNGVIFGLAGVGLLLAKRRWWAALVFSGVAALVGTMYLIDLWRHHSWALYWQQLHPAVASATPGLAARLLYLLAEHQRFFHSPKEVALSLLLLPAAWLLFRQRARLDAEARHLLAYTGLLMLALDLIAQGKTSKYLLPYLPQLLLLVVLAATYLPLRLHKVALALLGVYVAVNFAYTATLLSEQRAQQYHNQLLAERLAAYRGKPIVAPVNFIFPAIADFRMQGATFYFMLATEYQDQHRPFNFFAATARQGFPLLILDPEALRELHLPTPAAPGQRFGPYQFAFADYDHYVYCLAGSNTGTNGTPVR